MAHVHFLTFGDGSPAYRAAVARIMRQAKDVRLFKSARGYTLRCLRTDFPAFWRDHGAFITANSRGCGYWLWKPFLIRERLTAIPDGDFLIYADCGCEIHVDAAADIIGLLPSQAGQDLLAYNGTSDLGYRGDGHLIRDWTNAYTLDRIDTARDFLDNSQIWAGLLYLRNSARTRMLAERWFELAAQEDGALIVDRPKENELPDFIEHRHDQAILSILVYALEKSSGLDVCFRNYPEAYGLSATAPIRGSRNRTGVSWIAAQRTPAERARLWLGEMSRRLCVRSILKRRSGYTP